ncbi:MAG: hypothetical protein L0338_39595 [Acidobacteria bacterium]|nr:hypothetical protein [Acidobacteriota bacterium]
MANVGQLSFGQVLKVFDRATGGAGDDFNLPPESGRSHGAMVLQAIGVGGTITALVVDLEISLDGGTTFNKLVIGITLTANAQKVDIAGLGSGARCRLVSTTFTLGTATSIQILGLAG